MTAELLIAIALLCNIPNGFTGSALSGSMDRIHREQLECQKYYINCIIPQTTDATQAPKALANCVKVKP